MPTSARKMFCGMRSCSSIKAALAGTSVISTEAKRNGISTMIQISVLDTTAAIVPS